jgi:hypothetical protein
MVNEIMTTITIQKEKDETQELKGSSSGLRRFLKVAGYALIWAFVVSLALGSFAAGLWTLIPTELLAWGSSKLNILGYVSHCPFAPFSSTILFVASAIGVLLAYKISKGRTIGLGVFMGVGVGLAIGALGGIDIVMFIGMGAGVGIGFVLGLFLGLFREKEL